MLKECENAYERDAVNGKEVDTPYLSRDILTIKLNDSDFTGLVLSDEAYDEGGLLSSKVEFEYDENGALTLFKRESYEEGELSSSRETKYEYDSDGVVVKESSYDSEGRLTALREYWPNTSDATAKHRENILKASYQYDEDGNITGGFDYDEEGNVIKTYPGY